MAENKTKRDPIPVRFKTVDEFDEFWSKHSLADYDDVQRDAHFNIKLDDDEVVSLQPMLARELRRRARRQKITVSELVNQLLEEKLRKAA